MSDSKRTSADVRGHLRRLLAYGMPPHVVTSLSENELYWINRGINEGWIAEGILPDTTRAFAGEMAAHSRRMAYRDTPAPPTDDHITLIAARMHLWDYSKLLEEQGKARQAETIRQVVDRLTAMIESRAGE